MSVSWTAEQILSLAPDDGSKKDGRKLATARPWVMLGQTDAAIWGECQGSGKNPYQVQIDLSEPAFKCNCPSRKFPCKHGLALFLLLVEQPSNFIAAEPPEWVSTWLAGRAKRAETKAAKVERGGEVTDKKAQEKRVNERQTKINGGVTELEIWLKDILRNGMTTVQAQGYRYWDDRAKRMVDAQAPGLARMVREMGGVATSGDGWQARLLEKFGRVHLLLESWQNLENLPPELQIEVRNQIGMEQKDDALSGQPGVRDTWLVAGQTVEEDDKLKTQRTWLVGKNNKQPALVLSFSVAGRGLDVSLVVGSQIEAELVYYPANLPLRASVKTRTGNPVTLENLPGVANIAEGMELYAAALARNPWLDRFPICIENIVPVVRENKLYLRDKDGYRLPAPPAFAKIWQLVALSGGYPLTLFGTWDGDYLSPLSAVANGKFVAL
jgi:hypothetical protein